jgi:hypothetical protein
MSKSKRANSPAPAAKKQTAKYEPPTYHPDAGKKALLALTTELDAFAESDLTTLKVDVEAATYAALGVAGFIADPLVHARFARLPKEEFDLGNVDGLGPSCFATLYALGEARAAGALETEAKVAPQTQADAAEVEKRMQAVCEYYLSDDLEIKPELDRLRPGNGNRDIANDLLGYARIYDLRPGVVKTDPKNYRPDDAAKARELAGKIIQALSASMTPKARVAYDRYVRAWTRLNRCYDEVRPTGLWLYRRDPLKEQRFPSLFAAGRPNVGRPKKQTEAPTPPVGDVNDAESPPVK